MQRILNILLKELHQLKRDRRMLGIAVLAPLFQLIILTYAATLDVKELPIVIYDEDHSSVSRALIQKFTTNEYFQLEAVVESDEAATALIEKGAATIYIRIPQGLEERTLSNEQSPLPIIVDAADANSATIGLNYANVILLRFSAETGSGSENFLAMNGRIVKTEIRNWYNPALKSRYFIAPGILALLIMVITTILTALAIVKEKEIGTLEQLMVTPIKPWELIIGKLLPFGLIGFIDIILALSVLLMILQIPMKGAFLLMVILSIAFSIATLGLGLFVSTIARNQQQAMMTAIFFIMMPMIYLSGFIFPIQNMPKILQTITYAMPLRYYFIIIRGIFLKGTGMAELWDETLIMLFLGCMTLLLSIKLFHKHLD